MVVIDRPHGRFVVRIGLGYMRHESLDTGVIAEVVKNDILHSVSLAPHCRSSICPRPPDGETFAALSATALPSQLVPESNRLVIVNLGAGSSTTAPTSDIDGSGHVAWSRDGKHLAFTGYQAAPNNISEVRTYNSGERGAILRTVNIPDAHGTAIAAS